MTKVRQDMEALENRKRSYDSTHKQHINKKIRKKENRRKPSEGKGERTENNVQ